MIQEDPSLLVLPNRGLETATTSAKLESRTVCSGGYLTSIDAGSQTFPRTSMSDSVDVPDVITYHSRYNNPQDDVVLMSSDGVNFRTSHDVLKGTS
jgi:hypothetical protein